jgi:hypothetical protein
MRRLLVLLLMVCGLSLAIAPDTSAVQSLKIAPQSYDATLQKAEVKKGYVDVSNPGGESVRVKLEVQAFRQIADDGSLEFYDSEQVRAGVQLDYETLTLGPREAYRVYFLLDGNKLPQGDVFGAIFVSTIPDSSPGSAQAVRVGTILTLQNGTPTAHTANITSFATSWLHIGEGLSSTIVVTNPADPKSSTGFYPNITVSTAPYGSRDVKGPLVFAGRTRTVDYKATGDYFGPIWFGANIGDSKRGQFIFAVTGYWRWLAPLLLVILVVGTAVSVRVIRGRKTKNRNK